jgi:hypothetical protein
VKYSVLLSALILLLACGTSSDPTAPTTGVVGNYQLIMYDGSPLPAIFGEVPDTTLIRSGVLKVHADSTFQWSADAVDEYASGSFRSVPFAFAGTYVLGTNSYLFTDINGGTWPGYVHADTLMLNWNGENFTFVRTP